MKRDVNTDIIMMNPLFFARKIQFERIFIMTVFSIILGVLLIIAGIVCLATPLGTAFALMYLFIILLFVMGIVSFVRCIANKEFGIDFVFAIITILLGLLILLSPYATFITEGVMIYLMAGWLVVRGIVGIVLAAKAKPLTGGGLFAVALIVNIIMILAGIFSFVHPLFITVAFGILASCYFIVAGIDLIAEGVALKSQK